VGVSALYHLAPTAKAISAFADYSGTVAGTVKATSVAHGRSTGDSVIISGTANYNATKTITVIDVDNFYFTATWVSTQTGWWTLSGYVASNNTALGYYTGLGITTGSGNTVLGANVTGLSANLTNNIILANGTGAIKAQHDGTNWALTGGVSATAGLSGTTGRFSDVTDINLTTLAQGSIQTSGGLSVAKSLTVGGNVIIVGTQAAASGFGGNLRYRDDTGTARWLTGLKGTAAATSYTITDLVASADRLTIDSAGATTFGNTVTATQFIGSGAGLTGTATSLTAGNATLPYTAGGNTSAVYLTGFTTSGTGYNYLYTNSPVYMSAGTVYATNFGATSDERLKTNITPILNPIDKIKNLNGFYFNWNELAPSLDKTTTHVGVSAQHTLKTFPEAVVEGEEYLSVTYNSFIPLLIECVKEQQKEIEELKRLIHDFTK
jgi:hypothetical protein